MKKFNIPSIETKKSKALLKEVYSIELKMINQKNNPEKFIGLKKEYKHYLFSYLDNISNIKVSNCLERILYQPKYIKTY